MASLETLANLLGGDAHLVAAKAAIAIRYVLGIRNRAAAVSYGMGWVANEKEIRDYASALTAASKELAALESLANS